MSVDDDWFVPLENRCCLGVQLLERNVDGTRDMGDVKLSRRQDVDDLHTGLDEFKQFVPADILCHETILL